MRRLFSLLAIVFLGLTSCAPAATPVTPQQIIPVYATDAAQPWLTPLYSCAARQSVVIYLTASAQENTIILRLGEPAQLNHPSYEIGRVDIHVVSNAQSALQTLSLEQVRSLFGGFEQSDAQLWVYAESMDAQQIFNNSIQLTGPLASQARLALSVQHMFISLKENANAVGILPEYMGDNQLRVLYTVSAIPVLAILPAEPDGALVELLTCLQNTKPILEAQP